MLCGTEELLSLSSTLTLYLSLSLSLSQVTEVQGEEKNKKINKGIIDAFLKFFCVCVCVSHGLKKSI